MDRDQLIIDRRLILEPLGIASVSHVFAWGCRAVHLHQAAHHSSLLCFGLPSVSALWSFMQAGFVPLACIQSPPP